MLWKNLLIFEVQWNQNVKRIYFPNRLFINYTNHSNWHLCLYLCALFGGRKQEYPGETHMSDLVTTWQFTLHADARYQTQDTVNFQHIYYAICLFSNIIKLIKMYTSHSIERWECYHMAKRTAFIISTLTVNRWIQIKVLLCLAVKEVIIRFSKSQIREVKAKIHWKLLGKQAGRTFLRSS